MKLFRVSFKNCVDQEQVCLVVASSAERAKEIVGAENIDCFNYALTKNREREIDIEEISLKEEDIIETYYY